MIDTDNLKTASLYINNQLLSRGLLKDGQSIDFANPEKPGRDSEATMGQIITVVNDLILRRDRDAEHRDSLSTTMRNLRAENLKLTKDVTRLTDKNTEAQRKVDLAESSESSMKTQLKSAEAAVRGLKDEVTRTKALVAQVRATCATDVRRRDRQIDTLKKQLAEAGRARGSRTNPAITTINVTGDFGAETTLTKGSSIAAEDYNLRSETNAFLAKLAQDLSEENESMLGAMRQAMSQLRQMSGYNSDINNDGHATRQPSWDDMSADLDSVMEHMKTILTNPSFVPIEEVMVREEEIDRLKDGWVKMESRWKEAVHLIDSWRKKMAASGKPVNEEELQMSLRLSPVRVRIPEERREIRGFSLAAVAEEDIGEIEPIPVSPSPSAHRSTTQEGQALEQEAGFKDSYSGSHDSAQGGQGDQEDSEMGESNFEVLHESTAATDRPASRESSPLPEPPQLSPLRASPSAGNRGPSRREKPGREYGDFTTIVEENTRDLEESRRQSPKKQERRRLPSGNSLDEALLSPAKPASYAEPESENENQPLEDLDSSEDELSAAPPQKTPRRTVSSKLPVPRNTSDATTTQSPLTMATIAAKLAASEREADAARVRAKLKSFRGAKRPTVTQAPEPEPEPEPEPAEDELVEDVDPVKLDPVKEAPKPEKRKRDKRTGKAASRRRSTLSPWELNSLISGDVQG